MATRPRSPKHEYELYVELEIERYKDKVPRRTLLAIGDEAVKSLETQAQTSLTELLLCAEVDRIIKQRLGLQPYVAWKRKQAKTIAEWKKPERWGMRADDALVRAAKSASPGHFLLAGAIEEGPALYLAANGCEVITLDPDEETLERVHVAAAAVGLTSRIHGLVADLGSWSPDGPLNAVVCAAAAFSGLSDAERRRARRSPANRGRRSAVPRSGRAASRARSSRPCASRPRSSRSAGARSHGGARRPRAPRTRRPRTRRR